MEFFIGIEENRGVELFGGGFVLLFCYFFVLSIYYKFGFLFGFYGIFFRALVLCLFYRGEEGYLERLCF